MQQLNLFSNENLNISSKKTKKERFDFNNSLDKVIKLRQKISDFHKKQDDESIETPLKMSLNIGKELKLLYENRPYIIKEGKTIILFDYLEDFDHFEIYSYIREYEVYQLLKDNGFKILPSSIDILLDLFEYTDNQIIEIWQEILKTTTNFNPSNIVNLIFTISQKKNLTKIEYVNLSYAYKKYSSNVFQQNFINHLKYEDEYNDELKSKIKELEEQLALAYAFNTLSSMKNNSSGNKSPYDILGVNKNSSKDEIKKAYRSQSTKYHTDKILYLKNYVNDPNQFTLLESLVNDKFKEIKQAYDILN